MPEHEHVLLRELKEQPSAVRRTVDVESEEIWRISGLLSRKRIHFLGMGSSYYAGIYGRYLVAGLAGRTSNTHLASEFVHYPSPIGANEAIVTLSQSGESVETVRAVRLLKKRGNLVVGVTNDAKSTLARLSDHILLTHAGREKASSTKTFATALATLYLLATSLATRSGRINERRSGLLRERLVAVSRLVEKGLGRWIVESGAWSSSLARCRAAVVIARGPNLAAALQGALLFKEVAKIPAEGMSSGEFAHGPIEALTGKIRVVILGGGRTTNLQYGLAARSRSLHSDPLMITPHATGNFNAISFGNVNENLAAFFCAPILELLAYQAALKKQLNPDRFRFIQKVTTQE